MLHAAPSVYAQFFPVDPALGGFGFGGFGYSGFGAPFSGFYGPQQGAGFYAPQFAQQGGFAYPGAGLNQGYLPSGSAAFPNVPYVPLSSNSSTSSNSDTRTYLSYNQGYNTGINTGYNPGFNTGYNPGFNTGYNPGFNTGYNPGFLPGGLPTTGAFGPAAAMYGQQAGIQPFGYSGFAPAAAAGFAPFGQAAGIMNPFMGGIGAPFANPFAAQMGPFMQPVQMGPFGPQIMTPWNQNLIRQQQGFNPWNPYAVNPYNPYPTTGDDDDDDDDDTAVTDDIPDIRGYWSGTWTILETDTDPNGMQIIVEVAEGDILFHVTYQKMTGGELRGTVEITGWDAGDFPDWHGEEDQITLTGWIDKYSRLLYAHYFNFTGDELKSDLSNLICDYTWNFDNLKIKDTGFSGNFSIHGTNNYYAIGTFNVGKYSP
ncbi:MAG: hypothetical protein ACMUIS_01960 [bacterium]